MNLLLSGVLPSTLNDTLSGRNSKKKKGKFTLQHLLGQSPNLCLLSPILAWRTFHSESVCNMCTPFSAVHIVNCSNLFRNQHQHMRMGCGNSGGNQCY